MSQIKPKSLRLDFENIDWCKIPINMVTDLKIYNIHHDEFVSYPESNDYASRNIHTIADNVKIKLDINMIEKAKLSTNDGIPIIERIRGGHDIYYVALVDENNKEYIYEVDWNGQYSNKNDRQKVSNHDPEIPANRRISKEFIEWRKKSSHYQHEILEIEICDLSKY